MRRLSPFLAFSGFYGAVFLSLGILIPFWPLWLSGRGLSPEQVGLVLACAAWARAAAVPAIGYLADRSGRPRAALLVLAVLSLVTFVTFPATQGFWGILVVQILFAVASHPLIPIAESQALAADRAGQLDYGRMRLWGSATFIAGSLGTGLVVAEWDASLIVAMAALAIAATTLTVTQLPAGHRTAQSRTSLRDALRLASDRRILLLMASAGLLQASHAAYYGFSALHWQAAGYGEGAIALLWSLGVVAEILLFLYAKPLSRRLGPRGLLAIAGLGGLVRWSLTAVSTDPFALIIAQSLHALTFGAAHLGTMQLLTRTAPVALAATAQGLYAAVSGGLFMGFAAVLSGYLYDIGAAQTFGTMAALSALALLGIFLLARTSRSFD